jgi:hypothetical protein
VVPPTKRTEKAMKYVHMPVITWDTARPNGSDFGHVKEYEDGVLKITYGPMPRDWLGPFVDDCRERVERLEQQLKAIFGSGDCRDTPIVNRNTR